MGRDRKGRPYEVSSARSICKLQEYLRGKESSAVQRINNDHQIDILDGQKNVTATRQGLHVFSTQQTNAF